MRRRIGALAKQDETCGFKWDFKSRQLAMGDEVSLVIKDLRVQKNAACGKLASSGSSILVTPWTRLKMDDLGAERIGESEIDGDGIGRPYSTDYEGLR